MSDANGNPMIELIEEGQPLHVDWYEGLWIRISVGVLVVFIGAVLFSSSAYSIQVPGAYQRVDPQNLTDTPFNEPGIRELAPGKYEVYMLAATWQFVPNEIRVPAGSTVKFYVTSPDVQHGFKIMETNVNMMVLPGQVSTLSTTFDEPGAYNLICHEYCGYVAGSPIGHHTMFGQIIVEAAE
ncbi:MAG: cytochrome c oxidase subunit II [Caldilineaceae bacterium]